MPPDFDARLRSMAEVIVRIGLNLQPGQPLLVTDPYDLQGIHPEAESLVAAVRTAGGTETNALIADPIRLRALAEAGDLHGYEKMVAGHTSQLRRHLARGGAFLFLTGSHPQLMAGLPAEQLAAFDEIKWQHLGPIIQRLVRGVSQWTLAPAPTAAWADTAHATLPTNERLPALWETVFAATRVGTGDPVSLWHTHLASLSAHRDRLNTARHRSIRYRGPGTDLVLDLPGSHAWCTAQLVSKAGVPFVVNLPTEEIFSAPHKASARGTVRVSRPVIHGGVVIDGIELEFKRGRAISLTARTGLDTLKHLLATDGGACRIGEVALVPALTDARTAPAPSWQSAARLFHHTLLDENASHHIALGEAYPFCSRAFLPLALNRSQIHVDLPLEAEVELE